jgi:hypothetical protein
MKIKTVVFWMLWVGNDLTLQTVREQDLEPALPPSFFPNRGEAKLNALTNVMDRSADNDGAVRTGRSFAF